MSARKIDRQRGRETGAVAEAETPPPLSTPGVVTFLWQQLGSFRWPFAGSLALGVLDGAIAFAIPFLLARFLTSRGDASAALQVGAWVVGLFVLSLAMQWVMRLSGEAIRTKVGYHFRLRQFDRLERESLAKLGEQHSGYALSLINRVADESVQLYQTAIWGLASALSLTVLLFVYLGVQAPIIVVVNVVTLLVFFLLSTKLAAGIARLADDANHARARMLESYADFLGNLGTVKRLGLRSLARGRLGTLVADVDGQTDRYQRYHANRWLGLHAVFGLTFFGTLFTLLYLIANGRSDAAVLLVFAASYGQLRGQVERLSEAVRMLMEMRSYVNALRSPERGADADANPADWQQFRAADVLFSYPGSEREIRIPELTLERGERLMLSGTSGEGKTTMLHLMANLLSPQNGGRFVDDIAYDALSAEFFSSRVALVSQGVELFDMTIRENLELGRHVDEDDILALLTELHLSDWLAEMPDGLDTRVGERGLRLSAGQQQRLNVARALLLDRDIYFLDEPTSHLDQVTERAVVDCLVRRLANKTALIVSHRPLIRELCSRELQVQGGALR